MYLLRSIDKELNHWKNENDRKPLLVRGARQVGISAIMIEHDFDTINKGSIAELFVGLELIKCKSPYEKSELYYWHRESTNSSTISQSVTVRQL